jgi:hypothetical protein
MAGLGDRSHASAIATMTSAAADREQAIAALRLERQARSLLAERIHDGVVQNIAAALLLLSSLEAEPGHAERLERSIEIVRAAFTTGRREVVGSLDPIDRPLAFTLRALIEQTGAPGRVCAPERRYPAEAEAAVFHAVQDAVVLGGWWETVDVRVIEGDGALIAAIRTATGQVELLASALDHRLALHGGAARKLRRGGGVALRVPLAHSV